MKRSITTLLARLCPFAAFAEPDPKPTPPTDHVADLRRAMEVAVAEGLNRVVVGKPDWTVANFEISCESGTEPMTGLVKRAFAIHQVGFVWSLTHLPTGLAIARHPIVIRLFSLAERLLPLPCWDTVLMQDLRRHLDGRRVAAEVKAWYQEAPT